MTVGHDVFVVTSPFQLVNAAEAIAAYGCSDPTVVVVRQPAPGMVQLEGVLARDGLRDVDDVRIVAGLDEVAGAARRVFLGDYREPEQRRLARSLGVDRPVLLDDGNATLMIARRRQHRLWRLTDRRAMSLSAHSHRRRYPVPTLLRDVRDPGARECRGVELFSIYDVRGGRHDSHRDNSLVGLRRQIRPATDRRPVFIGSSLVETGIMRPDAYRRRVADAVAATASSADGPMVYIAHRKELDENLDRLRHDLGVEVVRPSVPIELMLLDARIEPTTIRAVLSSAYDTLRMIFPGVPAQAEPPRPDEVEDAYRKPVAAMVELAGAVRLVPARAVDPAAG